MTRRSRLRGRSTGVRPCVGGTAYALAMLLYDNPFSPFARKVFKVLVHKGLSFDTVDGLAIPNGDRLAEVNPRREVPALSHDGRLVVNSADICAYLERRFPDKPVYPTAIGDWTRARAWERCADHTVDPILINISYWMWANRSDAVPEGLVDAAKRDLDLVYAAMNRDLEGQDFLCGELSIADFAMFSHLTSTRTLGVSFDVERYPHLLPYLKRLRSFPAFQQDLARTKKFLAEFAAGTAPPLERDKIFWRGDRIEWMLARGYHDWFLGEIEAGRVLWPGLGIPA